MSFFEERHFVKMSSSPEEDKPGNICGVQCGMKGVMTINKHGLREITVVELPSNDRRRAQGRRSSAGVVHCLAVPGQDKEMTCLWIWWPLEHNGLH